MAPIFSTLAGLSLSSIALASPHASPLGSRATAPCAQVAEAIAGKDVDDGPRVPAKLAYNCITSIPFNQQPALRLVDSIVPYLKWQSNTAWVAVPPQEYAQKVQPAYDLWARFKVLRDKVVAGEYKTEYEVSCFFTATALNMS